MTMTFNDILAASGLSMAELSRRYAIPYKTLQHWRDGSRVPPDYVLVMLDKLVRIDRIEV